MPAAYKRQSSAWSLLQEQVRVSGAWATKTAYARVAGAWSAMSEQYTAAGVEVPPGALDSWVDYIATPGRTASERGEIILISDSTGFGAGGEYSIMQRIRDRAVSAGYSDGGKGMFAGAESEIGYDAPEINGFVSSTYAAFPDSYDLTGGQFYYDLGTAGHLLTLQFRQPTARLWYMERANAGSFRWRVDGGAWTTVVAYTAATPGLHGKYVYISGLAANTTHTLEIENLGGRPSAAPAGISASASGPGAANALADGTYYYVATYVFGGGETVASNVSSIVLSASRTVTVTVPEVGQDSVNIYRATSSGGPFQYVTSTRSGGSSSVGFYGDSSLNTPNAGQNPPTVGTTNLNTSSKSVYVALAPMNTAGVSVQKYASTGGTMATYLTNDIARTWACFGLAEPTGDRTLASSYSIDTDLPASGRVNPKLAILQLGFNDLSTMSSSDTSLFVTGVLKFAAMCKARGIGGIVMSGQLAYNANWPTYGAAVYNALRTTALANGLAFADDLRPIAGASLSYSGGTRNPHLFKSEYILQADWWWDNILKIRALPVPPVASVAPSISGTGQNGATLTCAPGTWTGSPAFTYQWKRNGTPIGGATAATYVLTGTDIGTTITCTVTATKVYGGSASATATGPAITQMSAPANTVAPAITGTALTGNTLTTTTGTWTSNVTPTYAYQWKRNGSAISAATASTYVLQAADEAQAVTCTVTATNAGGSASATGNTITPAAPFSPSVLTPAAWYKADAITGLSDGAAVSSWIDSSGNSLAAVQATGGAQPLYKTAILNGYPVVRFDGSNDFLKYDGSSNFISGTAVTVFIVAKATAAQFTRLLSLAPNGASETAAGGMVIDQSSGGGGYMMEKNNASIATKSLTVSTWHYLTALWNNGAGELGADGGTRVTGSNADTTMTVADLVIGANAAGSFFYMAVDVAEIVIFGRLLNSTEIGQMQTYLHDKYGL